MKNWETVRLAVLIDTMAECIGADTKQIIAGITGDVISEEEAGEIERALEKWESE